MSLSRLLARARPGLGLFGLAAGVVAGSIVGSMVSSVARPTPAPPQSPVRVLHVAPVLALPGAGIELAAAALCEPPDSAACQVAEATARVLGPSGEWSSLFGAWEAGAYRWRVPPELVGEVGISYYLELRMATGRVVRHPAGGERAPLVVSTTAGFAESSVAELSWQTARPDSTALRMRFGSAPGRVGRTGGEPGSDVLTASSFDVEGDGRIYVADWVNDRIQVFSPFGLLERTLPAPVHRSFDLEAGGGTLGLLTLGSDGVAYRISSSDGRVLERSAVGIGIAARLAAGAVFAGPGQWMRPFGSDPRSLAPAPGTALSQDLSGSAFAARWSDERGGTVGAIVTLPAGFRVGADYFVEPIGGGGAVVTRGVWDDMHAAVGVFTFDGSGTLVSVDLLPEPSSHMDAVFSTVRWHGGAVYLARDRRSGLSIDVFEVI